MRPFDWDDSPEDKAFPIRRSPISEWESVICSACNGSGEGSHEGATCGTCGGSGEIEMEVNDANE